MNRTSRWIVGLVALLASFGWMPGAAAGGWWSSLDVDHSQLFAPGEEVTIGTQFLFASAEEAEAAYAGERYYVFLIRGLDLNPLHEAMTKPNPDDWWEIGAAEAIQVGEVILRAEDGNIPRANSTFVVPEVAPGIYHVMFCDAGCVSPLGDIIPTRMKIADPFSASLSRKIERMRARQINHKTMISENEMTIAALQTETDRLRGVVRDLRGRPAPEVVTETPAWLPWAWVSTALLALFAGWLLRRRSAETHDPEPLSRRLRYPGVRESEALRAEKGPVAGRHGHRDLQDARSGAGRRGG